MIGVLVTFSFGDDFNETRVRAIADKARHKFEGMPGVRSKAFTVDATAKQAVNFYVWESDEAARAFFNPQVVDSVTALYGVRPSIQYMDIAALVDNGATAASATP